MNRLVHELSSLRKTMLHFEAKGAAMLEGVSPAYAASARNLFHYLALRQHDLRPIQERLAALGLSSLGRAEGSVLAAVNAVLSALRGWANGDVPMSGLPDFSLGQTLLKQHTEALLGPAPAERGVRVMVTMPPEAAANASLVRDLLAGGMDCMRINCAHDGPEAWLAMIRHLRRAEKELRRSCRVLMDLPGPKLRTGAIEPGPRVLKWKPQRDVLGRVIQPARIFLTPSSTSGGEAPDADAVLPVPAEWLPNVRPGDRIRFCDARGAGRTLLVTGVKGGGRWAEAYRTAYVTPGMQLRRFCPGSTTPVDSTVIGMLPALAQSILLKRGDVLVLTRDATPGRPATRDEHDRLQASARIPCTLPEIFTRVKPGQPIWLDDGKIGGIIRHADADEVHVEITHARASGEKLGPDKGINLPDSDLQLPALTQDDLRDLDFVAAHADLVGLSFVHEPADVATLNAELAKRERRDMGVVLKIETRQGFEQLPRVLLAAMAGSCIGVMIARGDLAVECGFERLAELQEEILWICEAAHVPVVWATQVLEHLAKEGAPSRAEITDAAMGERAECVMLNKGPHIVKAVCVLDDILRRMEGHQHKKRSMLRELRLARGFYDSPHPTAVVSVNPTEAPTLHTKA
jgi:pyruvate kinase